MKRKAMAGGEYSKLSQADEETGCQFVRQEKHRHENDARRRLVTACLFCVVFIICEVTGKEKITECWGNNEWMIWALTISILAICVKNISTLSFLLADRLVNFKNRKIEIEQKNGDLFRKVNLLWTEVYTSFKMEAI